MKVIKSYWEPESCVKDEYLTIDKISVISSESHYDCSYFEKIKLSFSECNEHGGINGANMNSRFVILLEIETGYIPDDIVAKDLKNGLSQYKIRNINELISAFKYRRYYCKI